jgi:contact-dependent growth inhibition (CDI) system CdiI-like immunity protein
MTAGPDIARLKNFFAGYFHEDWAEDAPDVDAVLEQFFDEGWGSAELRELGADIRAYIVLKDDEVLGDALFQDLGCYYDPAVDGYTARAWLRSVVASLDDRAGSQS